LYFLYFLQRGVPNHRYGRSRIRLKTYHPRDTDDGEVCAHTMLFIYIYIQRRGPPLL